MLSYRQRSALRWDMIHNKVKKRGDVVAFFRRITHRHWNVYAGCFSDPVFHGNRFLTQEFRQNRIGCVFVRRAEARLPRLSHSLHLINITNLIQLSFLQEFLKNLSYHSSSITEFQVFLYPIPLRYRKYIEIYDLIKLYGVSCMYLSWFTDVGSVVVIFFGIA